MTAPDADDEFPTNGDRFAAQDILKRLNTEQFTRKGFLCQAVAAGWHHKSADQLKELGDAVGRERISIIHGTSDNMITFPHAEVLVKELGGEDSGLSKTVFEGKGHVLPVEEDKEFNRLITEIVSRAANL